MVHGQKNIWLINQYATIPANGIGGRWFYLGQELAKSGFNITLFGASYNHIMFSKTKQFSISTKLSENFYYKTLNVFKYRSSNSLIRVLNWFVFSFQLLTLINKKRCRPTTIIYSSPSLIGFFSAWLLSKRYSARLILDVRDIWPLSLVLLGNISLRHPLVKVLSLFERFAYNQSDLIFSNLENFSEYLNNKVNIEKKQVVWIPNGISRDGFILPVESSSISRSSLVPGISPTSFFLGYTGSIGRANALHNLLLAIDLVRDLDLVVLIVGAGDEKLKLQSMVFDLGLDNVIFKDKVRKSEVSSILKTCDALYLGWKDEYLYRFGIAANKLIEYMYSGRPIIHSFSGCCDPVKKYKAGICSPAEDPQALADSIRRLVVMEDSARHLLGINGHKAAVEHYDYANIALKMDQYLN